MKRARLYVIQERYREAEALFTEGIEIGDSQLPGKDHPFTLHHVNGLGVLRTKQQRYEEAEALFNRALSGRKLKLGEDVLVKRPSDHYRITERTIKAL